MKTYLLILLTLAIPWLGHLLIDCSALIECDVLRLLAWSITIPVMVILFLITSTCALKSCQSC